MKEELCNICNKVYEAEHEDSSCPICFNGCCEPGYHNGEACDGSC